MVGRRENYTVSEVRCPSNLPCSCVESTGGKNNSALGNLTPSQPRQVSFVHAVSFACLLQSFEDPSRESLGQIWEGKSQKLGRQQQQRHAAVRTRAREAEGEQLEQNTSLVRVKKLLLIVSLLQPRGFRHARSLSESWCFAFLAA